MNKINQTNQDIDYQSFFRELNELGIDYLVIGGLAVNFHGIPRMTYDIDLMISFESENVFKVVNKILEWGFRPKVPIDPLDLADEAIRNSWIRDKGMKALSFYSETFSIGEIDLIVDSPIPYDRLKKGAVMIELQGGKVPTVSIRDLIELKLHAGRKQDESDVEHLKMILEKWWAEGKEGFLIRWVGIKSSNTGDGLWNADFNGFSQQIKWGDLFPERRSTFKKAFAKARCSFCFNQMNQTNPMNPIEVSQLRP